MSSRNVETYRIPFCRLVFLTVIVLAKIGSIEVPLAAAANDERDLVYSKKEEDLLNKLKHHPDFINLHPEEYMKSDYNLIRFLREANLDFDDTLDMIYDTMSWRKENNVSQILTEDWSDMLTEFPVDFGSRDLMNRPVLQAVASQWNVRQGVYYGDYDRFHRYSIYILERMTSEILKARGEGHTNVTRVVALVDSGGGDMSTHMCLYCISFYSDWLSNARNHYVNTMDEFIVTNVPSVISVAKSMLSPFLSEEMHKVVRAFRSSAKDEVMAILDEQIPRDRRIPEFGGTKAQEHPVQIFFLDRNRSEAVNVREKMVSGGQGVIFEYVLILLFVLVVVSVCICCVKCLVSRCVVKYDKVSTI